MNLAAWLLNTELSVDSILAGTKSPPAYLGIDELLLFSHLHQQCCEFALNQALHRTGGQVDLVHYHALHIIQGTEVSGTCLNHKLLQDYAKVESSADGLACSSNKSLTFASVSLSAQPHWVRKLIGPVSKQHDPLLTIVDAQVTFSLKVHLIGFLQDGQTHFPTINPHRVDQ